MRNFDVHTGIYVCMYTDVQMYLQYCCGFGVVEKVSHSAGLLFVIFLRACIHMLQTLAHLHIYN